MELLSPLVQDQAGVDMAQVIKDDPDGFASDQQLVARFVTLLGADVPDTHFQILSLVRKHLGTGGDERIRYTFPSLVFSAYRLVGVYKGLRESVGSHTAFVLLPPSPHSLLHLLTFSACFLSLPLQSLFIPPFRDTD